MIQEVKAAEAKLKSGRGLAEPDKSIDLMSDQSFTSSAKKEIAKQRAARDEKEKAEPKEEQPSEDAATKKSNQEVTKEDIERYNIEKRVLDEYLVSIITYENPMR